MENTHVQFEEKVNYEDVEHKLDEIYPRIEFFAVRLETEKQMKKLEKLVNHVGRSFDYFGHLHTSKKEKDYYELGFLSNGTIYLENICKLNYVCQLINEDVKLILGCLEIEEYDLVIHINTED